MGKGGGKKALAKVNLMMTVTGIFRRQRLESADKMLSVKEVKIISHFFSATTTKYANKMYCLQPKKYCYTPADNSLCVIFCANTFRKISWLVGV